MLVCVCVCVRLCVFVCAYLHVFNVCMSVFVCICMNLFMYVCVYTYEYMCVCLHVCVYGQGDRVVLVFCSRIHPPSLFCIFPPLHCQFQILSHNTLKIPYVGKEIDDVPSSYV